MPTKRLKAVGGRCKAMTKAGSSCAAPAIRGGEFCSLHSDPGRAAQLEPISPDRKLFFHETTF
jgi:hypothetical protein